MLLELIMKHSVCQTLVLCIDVGRGRSSRGGCPGKPAESGDDNEGAEEDTEPARLEWERGVAVTLQLCCGTAVVNSIGH